MSDSIDDRPSTRASKDRAKIFTESIWMVYDQICKVLHNKIERERERARKGKRARIEEREREIEKESEKER